MSDNGPAFAKALEERGLFLAQGDRRGHVAVSIEGEAFAIARMIDKKSKEVTARLGDPKTLRSVTDTRSEEHTSELQSLMRISYAVFCLKKNIFSLLFFFLLFFLLFLFLFSFLLFF